MAQRRDPSLGRDAEATKARLLAAATEEFAAHGIAGARVDRIADSAKVNKSLIYAYFGSKDELFDAVMNTHVDRLLDQVPFLAEDLPTYAGQLFDYLLGHPHQLRLASWYRLERGEELVPAAVVASMRAKTDAMVAARGAGSALAPEDLLVFLLAVVSAWLPASPHALPGRSETELASHREAVVAAVRLLSSVVSAGPVRSNRGE